MKQKVHNALKLIGRAFKDIKVAEKELDSIEFVDSDTMSVEVVIDKRTYRIESKDFEHFRLTRKKKNGEIERINSYSVEEFVTGFVRYALQSAFIIFQNGKK